MAPIPSQATGGVRLLEPAIVQLESTQRRSGAAAPESALEGPDTALSLCLEAESRPLQLRAIPTPAVRVIKARRVSFGANQVKAIPARGDIDEMPAADAGDSDTIDSCSPSADHFSVSPAPRLASSTMPLCRRGTNQSSGALASQSAYDATSSAAIARLGDSSAPLAMSTYAPDASVAVIGVGTSEPELPAVVPSQASGGLGHALKLPLPDPAALSGTTATNDSVPTRKDWEPVQTNYQPAAAAAMTMPPARMPSGGRGAACAALRRCRAAHTAAAGNREATGGPSIANATTPSSAQAPVVAVAHPLP
jgi:hypothetical protein